MREFTKSYAINKIAELTKSNQLLEDEIYRLKKEIVEQADYIIVELSAALQEIKSIAEKTNIDCIYRICEIRKILSDLAIQEVEE